MVDSRFTEAYRVEEQTQATIKAYNERCAVITAERGTQRDPSFSDEITDEALDQVMKYGFPEVDIFTIPDIAELQKTSATTDVVNNFIEADGVAYITMRSQQGAIPTRFEHDEVSNRLEHMGEYASNNSSVAVIDGTGKLFIAANSAENRKFLEEAGYKDAGRDFNVPFSNGEEPVGLSGKQPSYAVHLAMTGALGRTSREPEAFDRIVATAARINAPKCEANA